MKKAKYDFPGPEYCKGLQPIKCHAREPRLANAKTHVKATPAMVIHPRVSASLALPAVAKRKIAAFRSKSASKKDVNVWALMEGKDRTNICEFNHDSEISSVKTKPIINDNRAGTKASKSSSAEMQTKQSELLNQIIDDFLCRYQ